MKKYDTLIGLILLATLASTALIIVLEDSVYRLLSMTVLVVASLLATRLIDVHLDRSDAIALYALLSTFIILGSLIGAVISHSIQATLLATIISLIAVIYIVVAFKV